MLNSYKNVKTKRKLNASKGVVHCMKEKWIFRFLGFGKFTIEKTR